MARFAQAKNQEAHAVVLKSELQIISQALSEKSIELSLVTRQTQEMRSEGVLIREENERIRQNSFELNKQIDEKTSSLESKETKSKSIEQKARGEVLRLEAQIKQAKEALAAQVFRYQDNNLALAIQENEMATNQLTLDDIRGKISAHNEDLRLGKLAKNKLLIELDKQIKDKSKELETVASMLEAERVKISMPMELLRRANQEINQKKADLDIFKNQLDDHWEDVLRRRKL